MTMKHTNSTIYNWLATLALGALIWATPAVAQTQNAIPQDTDNLTRQQLAGFDRFLDNHPELDEQIRQNPSLVNNEDFVENHPDLQRYLQEHPDVREDIKENPNAVMRQEQRFDRREDSDSDRDRDRDGRGDITRHELANMDRFLDSHPEIAEQLRKNPSLVNNKEFVEDHPALQQFLAEHPGVREEIRENPNAFMHQEQRFDRQEDRRDRDVTRGELANMDRFMDSHPEIAEQLRKNPSLVNNKEFVENHPALQEFLENHPGVREEYKENPTAFMQQEQRFDRHEDSGMGRDREVPRAELSSFNEFLVNHNNISNELSKNPSLATNQEFLENHPQLRDYLKANPKVNEELSKNPQSFLKSAQTFEAPKAVPKLPTPEPKSK
jgi:phage-related protein